MSTTAATQKALFLPEKHANWKIEETAVPSPGPKEVLVKIISTALNPLDWKFQTMGIFVESYPFIGGSDAAGIVEQVGSEVTTLAKGDRILFEGWFDTAHATFQQYALVPAEITAKIPDNMSFDEAATVPVCFSTVAIGLWNQHPQGDSARLPAPWEEAAQTKMAGKPILILGGSSSVGQYAIQAAKLYKFSPIITTASPRNEGLLKTLGATHVLDRALPAPTLLASLQTIAGGSPLELVFDTISLPDTQALAYAALAPGGTLLVTLPDAVPAESKKASDGKKVVKVFGSVYPPENRQVGIETFKRLTEWLKTGVVVPNPIEVLPNGLAGIPEGLERLKANKVSGTKLVARPQETP